MGHEVFALKALCPSIGLRVDSPWHRYAPHATLGASVTPEARPTPGDVPVIRTHLNRLLIVVSGSLALAACARQHSDAFKSSATKSAVNAGSSAQAAGHGALDAGAARVGGAASAKLEPTGAAAQNNGKPVSGLGMFTETAAGVDLVINTMGCVLGKPYPVYIQEGTDCSAATLLGSHWDSPRGENIATLQCTGTTGLGRTFYTRLSSDKKPWTVGNPGSSDVLGHVLVVYDPTTLQPAACGQIVRSDPVELDAGSARDNTTPVALRAQIAGLCLAKMIVRDNTQECPNPAELAKCASEHCALDACVAKCTAYLACVGADADPCSAGFSCAIDDECSNCQLDVSMCAFGHCSDLVACAAPITPGGPCSQLEACCAMQGDGAASCLDTVHALEKFSGDPTCAGAMQDWDTTAHLAVPCKFK
jgi:hypothetical protein